MELEINDSTIDVGYITEVTSGANGWNIIIHEEGADYELGFPVYKEDVGGWFPCKGDRVEVTGMTEGLITGLAINDRVIFDRTEEEAAIWKEIRQHEGIARTLREKLRGDYKDNR